MVFSTRRKHMDFKQIRADCAVELWLNTFVPAVSASALILFSRCANLLARLSTKVP
jgi:hypothetical protein